MVTRKSVATILYCSRGIFHPSFWARKALKNILEDIRNATIITTNDLSFQSLVETHHPDLLVLYIHEKTIKAPDLRALETYVQNGGAILALHSASASFKQENRYHHLLGGRFTHHGPITAYEIKPANTDISILGTDGAPFSIKDELYLHQYTDDVEILLDTEVESRSEPVAWVKQHGQGKVSYFAPGHRHQVFHDQNVSSIIIKLVKWSLENE